MSNSQAGGSEPIMTKGTRKRRPADFISLVVALIIVAVIGVNYWQSQQATAPSPMTTDTTEATGTDTTPDVEPATDTTTPVSATGINTQIMRGKEFEQATRAESVINTSQKKTGADQEHIVTGVVQDETNPDLVYFATQSNNTEGNFVGVYQYNTKTFQWQRLYKNAYIPEGLGTKELRVIGKQDRTLILLVDRMNRDQNDCESYWLIGTEDPFSLVSINLDAPTDGLKAFTLPEDLRASEEARVAACTK